MAGRTVDPETKRRLTFIAQHLQLRRAELIEAGAKEGIEITVDHCNHDIDRIKHRTPMWMQNELGIKPVEVTGRRSRDTIDPNRRREIAAMGAAARWSKPKQKQKQKQKQKPKLQPLATPTAPVSSTRNDKIDQLRALVFDVGYDAAALVLAEYAEVRGRLVGPRS